MDREELRAVVPHYLAVMALVFVVVVVLDAVLAIPFWVGVVLALLIGVAYRPLVLALGVAPEPWREG
jgi:uncharacterized membrane protein YdjX (TVP38/TMEM64 family)